jgi:hypothetical protein
VCLPKGKTNPGRGRPLKVVQLIEKYELDGIGEDLEYLWTTDSDDQKSLRELADYFNHRIIDTVLAEAGTPLLNMEVETIHDLLVGPDVSAAERTRVKRRLEREGVDIDELRSDFVSYQAIRSYLTDHRGVDSPSEETDLVENAQ